MTGAAETPSHRIGAAPRIPHQAVAENPLSLRYLFGAEFAPPGRNGVEVIRRLPDGCSMASSPSRSQPR